MEQDRCTELAKTGMAAVRVYVEIGTFAVLHEIQRVAEVCAGSCIAQVNRAQNLKISLK